MSRNIKSITAIGNKPCRHETLLDYTSKYPMKRKTNTPTQRINKIFFYYLFQKTCSKPCAFIHINQLFPTHTLTIALTRVFTHGLSFNLPRSDIQNLSITDSYFQIPNFRQLFLFWKEMSFLPVSGQIIFDITRSSHNIVLLMHRAAECCS